MAEQMTIDDARHALWAIGDPQGWQPGSFTQSLISTISRADGENRARLWRGFEGLMQALQLARTEHGRRSLYEFCGVKYAA